VREEETGVGKSKKKNSLKHTRVNLETFLVSIDVKPQILKLGFLNNLKKMEKSQYASRVKMKWIRNMKEMIRNDRKMECLEALVFDQREKKIKGIF